MANSVNSYASVLVANTGTGANNYSGTLANSVNGYASILVANTGTGSNNYSGTLANSVNGYASVLVANTGTGANNFAGFMANSANIYSGVLSNSANSWANTKVAVLANVSGRIWANATTTGSSLSYTVDLANSGVTPTTYGGSSQVPVVTVDAYGRITSAANVSFTSGGMDYAYANVIWNVANASYGNSNAVAFSANSFAGFMANSANNWANTKGGLANSTITLAGALTTTGSVQANGYVYITPSGPGEGGEIQLQGDGSNTAWSIDAYQNNYRVFARTGSTVSNVQFFHAQVGGFVRMGVNRTDPLYTVDVAGQVNASAFLVNGVPISTGAVMDYAYVNAASAASNTWANTVGTAGNNYQSILVANTGAGGNNYSGTLANSVNGYASVLVANVALGANNYSGTLANSVNGYASVLVANTGVGANNYSGTLANSVNSYASVLVANTGTGANNYSGTLANSVNSYASVYIANVAIGANAGHLSANNFAGFMANSVNSYASVLVANTGTGANNYAGTLANSSNSYSNTTFVKLSAPGSVQTITGDIAITGNLTITGNTTSITANNLSVMDSMIYLASNNPADTMDIGFFASYINTTGSHVHTGLYRDHASKEYYLFQGLKSEPDANANNDIIPLANDMTICVLHTDVVAGNITLGSVNVYPWVVSISSVANAAYGNANAISTSVNAYASILVANTGTGSNTWANTVGTAGNNYHSIFVANVALGANNYSGTLANSVNGYAAVYIANVSIGANTYAGTVANASNTWANTKLSNTAGVTFAGDFFIPAGANLTIGTGTATAPLSIVKNGAASIVIGNTLLDARHNVNSFAQLHIRNANTGTLSSSDFIATTDDGTETTNYIDLGINGSGYTQPGVWTINGARDGYLYTSDSNLAIGVANSTSTIKYISFFIGGTTAADEVMRIQDSAIGANVGIGRTDPGYKVDVVGTINAAGVLVNGAPITGGSGISNTNNTSTVGSMIVAGNTYITGNLSVGRSFAGNGYAVDVVGTINASSILVNGAPLSGSGISNTDNTSSFGSMRIPNNLFVANNTYTTNTAFATHFDNVSDRSLKENIEVIYNSEAVLSNLNPVSFTWKKDGTRSYGFIAQEVEKVLPDVVHFMGDTKTVSYIQLIPFLIARVNEQQKQIDELRSLLNKDA